MTKARRPWQAGVLRAGMHADVIQNAALIRAVGIPIITIRTSQQRPVQILSAGSDAHTMALKDGSLSGSKERHNPQSK